MGKFEAATETKLLPQQVWHFAIFAAVRRASSFVIAFSAREQRPPTFEFFFSGEQLLIIK
jgi:hypothetical protein